MTELRHAIHALARSPGFVATAVVTLAVGIAANTTVMTLVDGLALRTIPATDADRLVRIYPLDQEGRRRSVIPHADYMAMREASPSLREMVAYIPETVTMRGEFPGGRSEPRELLAYFVSGNYFSTLGAAPSIGRTFTTADTAQSASVPTAVISHRLWRRLGGTAETLGRPIVVNASVVDVVGVMPPEFVGTEPLVPDLWLPLPSNRALIGASPVPVADGLKVLLLGRLNDGVHRDAAEAQLSSLVTSITSNRLPHDRATGVTLRRATFFPVDRDPLAIGMLTLLVTALLLAATAANVTNLLLTRALTRQREIAIRLAMGAARRRVAAQLLMEGLSVALAAGGLGLLLSTWALTMLSAILLPWLPFQWGTVLFDLRPDARLFAYTFALSLLATVVVGLTPALQGTRLSLTSALHGDAPMFATNQRLSVRAVMAVAQIAIGLALAIVAGLLGRSAVRAESADLGFAPSGVLTTEYDLSRHGYRSAQAATFTRQLADGASRLGSVGAMALASHLPLTGGLKTTEIWRPERGDVDTRVNTRFAFVSPGYFRVLAIPLARGRDVATGPTGPGRREAVVSEVVAARLWPRSEGIGERLRTGLSTDEYTVVGIARDTRASSLWRDKEAAVYLTPATDAEFASMRLVVAARTGDAAAHLRALARRLEPEVAFGVTSLEDVLALWMLPSRAAGMAGAFIAAIALLIASLGIYGVLAHLLAQRTREFGIRSALGAGRAQLVRLSLRQGLRFVAPGLLCGVLLAQLIARAIAGLLYDLSPSDGLTYVAATLVVCGSSLAACYLPARRAARVDPMTVLRLE